MNQVYNACAHKGDRYQAGDHAGPEASGRQERSGLVDDEREGIPHAELEADPCPQPFLAFPLGIHGPDRRKTWRREKIEHQVGQSRNRGEPHDGCHILGTGNENQLLGVDEIADAVDDRQGSDDVLFGDEPDNRCCSKLPHAEAKRNQEKGERIGYAGQDAGAFHAFFYGLEIPGECLHDLDGHIAQQNDRSRFHHEGFAS